MLTPAESFALQRNMYWVAPTLSAVGAMLVLKVLLPSFEWKELTILAVAVLTWLLAQHYIWLTVFDVRATLIASFILVFFFTLPMSVAMPIPWRHSFQLPWSAGSFFFQIVVLILLTLWRWRKLQRGDASSGAVLVWHRCRVNLKAGLIESTHGNETESSSSLGSTPLWVGAASVSAYPVLKGLLGEGGLLLFAAIAGHGIALWFHVEVVSHWWAQAFELIAIQRKTGQRFFTDQLERLEQERQSHWWGRFLRRIWPGPVEVRRQSS
jgi:hypothetical protein